MEALTESMKNFPESLFSYLVRNNFISMKDKETAANEITSEQKILIVLKMLQPKDTGWKFLIRFAKHMIDGFLLKAYNYNWRIYDFAEFTDPLRTRNSASDIWDSIRSQSNDAAPVSLETVSKVQTSTNQVLGYTLVIFQAKQANSDLYILRSPRNSNLAEILVKLPPSKLEITQMEPT